MEDFKRKAVFWGQISAHMMIMFIVVSVLSYLLFAAFGVNFWADGDRDTLVGFVLGVWVGEYYRDNKGQK